MNKLRLVLSFLALATAMLLLAEKLSDVETSELIAYQQDCIPCSFYEELKETDNPNEFLSKLISWSITSSAIFGILFVLGLPVWLSILITVIAILTGILVIMFWFTDWWQKR